MKYIKLFEGFKELEFIRTSAYKEYVKNKFQPTSVDDLLDWRSEVIKLLQTEKDPKNIDMYNREIKAVDYILAKHYK
jgi:hypothetical protein